MRSKLLQPTLLQMKLCMATAKANAALKATADTVDTPEVKLKATSTVEPLSANTAVADKAVVGVKATATLSVKVSTSSAEAKFDDSIPEASQVNFDVVAAEANLKAEANDEFKSSCCRCPSQC